MIPAFPCAFEINFSNLKPFHLLEYLSNYFPISYAKNISSATYPRRLRGRYPDIHILGPSGMPAASPNKDF